MSEIVTSIIIGIFVFFVTLPVSLYINKRNNKKEYYGQIKVANDEIINILVDHVIYFKNIDDELVYDVILAKSIEYKIDIMNFYSIEEIKSILVTKIICMRLIEVEERKKLVAFIKSSEPIKLEIPVKSENSNNNENYYKNNNREFVIIVTTFMAIFFILILNILMDYSRSTNFSTFAGIIIAYMAILVAIMQRLILKIKRKNKYKE